MTTEDKPTLIPTGEATSILPTGGGKPITVIGTEAIRATFDEQTLRQAIHSRLAPGVTDVRTQSRRPRGLWCADILTNCRQYPKDEAPAAYKDFNEVVRSVTAAGLASEVARLRATFVIKDASKADD